MMQIGGALSLTEGQGPRHMSWRNTARSILKVVSTIWTENTGIDRCVFLLHGFIWQLRKRLGHSLVTTLANGAKLKVYPNTAFSAAFYTRWLERKDLLFIRAHADLAPTFVDVGANVGVFSASLFDKFSYFILIEPARACVTTLRETCALNPSVQCEIINVAVSDRSGVASFLDEGDFSTTSRVVDESKADSLRSYPSSSKRWTGYCGSVERISSLRSTLRAMSSRCLTAPSNCLVLDGSSCLCLNVSVAPTLIIF